ISSFIFLSTCVALQRRWLLTCPALYCFSVLALNDKPNFLLAPVFPAETCGRAWQL
uniref:Uncharacterized protein n=1 Tax=Spermophilus dauricus TaxID=99837 RepID=A0A8C9Q996_SPEDA